MKGTYMEDYRVIDKHIHLNLQSFDWLASFHLQLLQAILPIAV